MRLAKYKLNKAAMAAIGLTGATIGMMPEFAHAAQSAPWNFFDMNGTTTGFGLANGQTYSWDSSNWVNTAAVHADDGTVGPETTYHQDPTYTTTTFPVFNGTTNGDTYTVTVGQTEYLSGMYQDVNAASGFGVTLNIVQANSSGNLNIPAPAGSSVDGFLQRRAQDTTNIYCPITGTGGVEQQLSGNLGLFGTNTFSGGFVTTGGQVTYYNNSSSFGAGSIDFTGSSGAGLIGNVAGVTIPNPLFFASGYNAPGNPITAGGGTTNFVTTGGSVSAPGTTWNGTVTLGGGGATTWQTGTSVSFTQFGGVITGGGQLIIQHQATAPFGDIIISNPSNNYTGGTVIAGGEVVVTANGALGQGGAEVEVTGGILGIAGNTVTDFNSSYSSLLGFSSGGFDIQSATNTYVYEPQIGQSGVGTLGTTFLSKIGAGTLVLIGQDAGTGVLADKAGTLVLRGDSPDTNVFIPGNGVDIQKRLVFDYTTAGGTDPSLSVLNDLKAGYGEATKFSGMTGTSFTSSLITSANSDTTHIGLGWRDDGTKITVAKTYYGDANLDGTVNALDFNALANGYGANAGSQVWAVGDFNYDGSVDSNDFALLAANYGKVMAGLSSAAVPDDGMVAQSLGSVVPEPTSLSLLAMASAAMWARRRRR